MQAYTQYETASAIRDAANNPGGTAGAGVGLGAGIAMGAQMMNNMNAGAANAGGGAVPPPIPGAAVYHVAINGAQSGPFDMATLQRQAATGEINRTTLVWKPGMAQWVKAGELAELAPLFANTPPPIPQ